MTSLRYAASLLAFVWACESACTAAASSEGISSTNLLIIVAVLCSAVMSWKHDREVRAENTNLKLLVSHAMTDVQRHEQKINMIEQAMMFRDAHVVPVEVSGG